MLYVLLALHIILSVLFGLAAYVLCDTYSHHGQGFTWFRFRQALLMGVAWPFFLTYWIYLLIKDTR